MQDNHTESEGNVIYLKSDKPLHLRHNNKEMLAGVLPTEEIKKSQVQVEPPEQPYLYQNIEDQILVPYYSYDQLYQVVEESSSLMPNIEAYVTNIDGYGYTIVDSIDLNDDAQKEMIRDENGTSKKELSDDELKALIYDMQRQQKRERIKVNRILDLLQGDSSFVETKKNTRMDLEVLGNGYWQVLRDDSGKMNRWYHYPAYDVWLVSRDNKPTLVKIRKESKTGKLKLVKEYKYFRRFYDQTNMVYFKEFGDPRIVSQQTGKYFDTIEEFEAAKSDKPSSPVAIPLDDKPATEMIHFKYYSSKKSPYGIPRWLVALPEILGKRSSAEINKSFFEQKVIPSMIMTVNNGTISKKSIEQLQEYVQDNVKGKENYHRMMIVEGISKQNNMQNQIPNVSIGFQQLQQPKDAQFMGYEEQNDKTIGYVYRLPSVIRGNVEGLNRSVLDTVIRFVEDQVFAPIRTPMDDFINKTLKNEFRISLAKIQSNSPVSKDSLQLAEILEILVRAAIITPEEARSLAGDIFNKPLKTLNTLWTKIPPAVIQYAVNFSTKKESDTNSLNETDVMGGMNESVGMSEEVVKAVNGLAYLMKQIKDEDA